MISVLSRRQQVLLLLFLQFVLVEFAMTAWAAEELTAKDLPTALSPRFLLPALQESRNQTATHIIAQWAAIFLGEIIVTTVLVIQTWRQRISDLVKEEASLETRRIAEIEIASVLPGPTGLIRMLLRGAYLRMT